VPTLCHFAGELTVTQLPHCSPHTHTLVRVNRQPTHTLVRVNRQHACTQRQTNSQNPGKGSSVPVRNRLKTLPTFQLGCSGLHEEDIHKVFSPFSAGTEERFMNPLLFIQHPAENPLLYSQNPFSSALNRANAPMLPSRSPILAPRTLQTSAHLTCTCTSTPTALPLGRSTFNSHCSTSVSGAG